MQTISLSDRFIFIGTVAELRYFLRTLPPDQTLGAFIRQRLQ
jgi:hypothetical protein